MDYRKSIQDLYDTLVKEFGLSEENLAKIVENRVEWTNERIQMAIEFTRFRMRQAPGKIKYPGIYLMNAIEKGDYNPTVKLCIKICKVLNKSLDELFWEDILDEEI